VRANLAGRTYNRDSSPKLGLRRKGSDFRDCLPWTREYSKLLS